MDNQDSSIEAPPTADIKERLRSWRKFLSFIRWALGAAMLLMMMLLLLRTHG